MKTESECFIDYQLWKLLKAIEHALDLQHNHRNKLDMQRYIAFELFERLGYASLLIDGDGTPGWTITEHGLVVLRDLMVEQQDEDEEDDEEDDIDEGELKANGAAELSYYKI
jgi:hypothetical protein